MALGRRQLMSAAAATLGTALVPSLWTRAARSAAAAPMVVPPWDAVPECRPSPTDRQGQGPFFIHNDERSDDVDLFRQDIRGRYHTDAEPGTEMQLHLRVLAPLAGACGTAPLRDVEVYLWHCDAQGYYSGFGEPGEQTPDQPYRFTPNQNDLDTNDRFCRGAGVSDANGVVSFRSIFPGWYNGRDIHLHTMVLKRGSQSRARRNYRAGDHLYTTQLYFQPELIDSVHRASQPYLRRTTLPAYAGSILGDERGTSGLRVKAQFSEGRVVAQMQMIIDPAASGS